MLFRSGRISGLKTHDCHMLLQRVLPAGLRGIVPKPMYEAIAELGRFFRELCAKTLRIEVLERMKVEIVHYVCLSCCFDMGLIHIIFLRK